MPHSDANHQNGAWLAITAETLYLVNLLFLPGIAFIGLLILTLLYYKKADHLARCHLKQTVVASLWAGVLLVIINGIILLLGGYQSPYTWIVAIIYFTTIHASMILLGSMGLARAMSDKHYHYPLIGPKCVEPSR